VLPRPALILNREDGMAKKRSHLPPAQKAVTAERAGRLYRLLQLLGTGAQTRILIMRRLKMDVRGFYRDLEALRAAGIPLTLQDHRYALKGSVAEAITRLPFPDPHLTLGEAHQLAAGRSTAHKKLKEQIALILESAGR
jgi:predicted DNA-binding transcriptional regulator YafY